MDKIIHFKDLQEKKDLSNLLNELTLLVNDGQYRKAFFIAYDVYDKYCFDDDFFIFFLSIVKEIDFVSINSASDNLLKSANGINPFGTDFLDNDYITSSNNNLIELLGEEKTDDGFGFDKQLKDYTMSLNDEYDDDDIYETFVDLDFAIIYEKIVETYDKGEKGFVKTSFFTELIAKNYINLNSNIHYPVLLKIREAYVKYSNNISIAFDFLSAMMFCSLMKTVPKNKIPLILNDSYKIYLDFEYENFAEVYSCLLFNYIDDLNDKEKSKTMFIIKDLMLDYDLDYERYIAILKIIINKRFEQSGKRNYKNILKDTKEIALEIKQECASFGLYYLVAINLFLQKANTNVTLSWIEKEVAFVEENFNINKIDIRRIFANSLALLINIYTTEKKQIELLDLLKQIVDEDADCFMCHSFYGLGISNFIANKNNIDFQSLEKGLKELKIIKESEPETYCFAIAHASHIMEHRDRTKAYNKIKKIKKINPYNEKLEFAELIVLKNILFDVNGDEFSAYFHLIESKLNNNVNKMSMGLEVEYLLAIQELSKKFN